MTVSLVVVTRFSAAELAGLLATRDGIDEVVAVDHSEDDDERGRLERLPVDRLICQPNAGYAAGLNRGAREASGEVLLLANPDLELAPGAAAALARAASSPGVGVAAPALLWDHEGRWRLPQATHHTWRAELAGRFTPRARTRAWHRRQLALWRASTSVATEVVSGTLMATTRAVFEATGGLDEGFFLFFEENDWCARVRRIGLAVLFVPEARAVHAVGHAVGRTEPEHYHRSLARYRRLHFPAWYRRLVPRPLPPAAPPPPSAAAPPSAECELLLSPSPTLVPAVLTRWHGGPWRRGALLPAGSRWNGVYAAVVEGERVTPLGPVPG